MFSHSHQSFRLYAYRRRKRGKRSNGMQFRVVDPYRWTFAVESSEQSLSQSLDSAIRYVVCSKMDDVLTDGREVTRQRMGRASSDH